MNNVFEHLKRDQVGHIATVSEDGKHKVRPFIIVHIEVNSIYFFTASYKEVYKQLLARKLAEFSVIPEKDLSIRINGEIVFDDDETLKQKILDLNIGIKTMYKGREDLLKLFHFEHGEIIIYDIRDYKRPRNKRFSF